MREVSNYGESHYTNDGRFHRPNGPASIWYDGDWVWYLNGKNHRYYGPRSNSGAWWIHDRRIKW